MIIKRISAPKFWKFERKTNKRFAIAPLAGPHPLARCMTLGYILRDVLKITDTAREARSLLVKGMVKVDGCVRKELGFPVGLMDVLTIGDSNWRILPGGKGLELKPIVASESKFKLLKVVNKTHTRGKTQLNFHDGRNMLVEKDIYKTSDVVVYNLADKSIKSVVQFKRGTLALIADGINRGKVGRVEDIVVVRGPQPNRVIIKSDKETIETLKDFAFAVGQDKPLIEIY